MPDTAKIKRALADLDEDLALRLAKEALDAGVPALDILKACQEGMLEVGSRFECQEYFVSDLMMSGEIFKQIGSLLEPGLKTGAAQCSGKVVFGTVKGDIHDIGKDIVVNMLKSSNLEVIDLGVDVAPERFVEAAVTRNASLVALSALLTVTMPSMKITIEAFQTAGLRERVKIMVGGAPVTQQYADAIGADGYGESATSAVALARKLMAA